MIPIWISIALTAVGWLITWLTGKTAKGEKLTEAEQAKVEEALYQVNAFKAAAVAMGCNPDGRAPQPEVKGTLLHADPVGAALMQGGLSFAEVEALLLLPKAVAVAKAGYDFYQGHDFSASKDWAFFCQVCKLLVSA